MNRNYKSILLFYANPNTRFSNPLLSLYKLSIEYLSDYIVLSLTDSNTLCNLNKYKCALQLEFSNECHDQEILLCVFCHSYQLVHQYKIMEIIKANTN